MEVTLDITGFYYSTTIDLTDKIKTVEDVMDAAKDKPGDQGGQLSFVRNKIDKRFIDTITVDYPEGSTPVTRQKNGKKPLERPTGKYTFTDDITDKRNRIDWTGGEPGILAWQYYVFDSKRTLKSSGKNNERVILPMAESDRKPDGVTLEDGDRIVWRLVTIFGIASIIDAKMDMLVAKGGKGPMSVKNAMALIDQNT